MIKNKGKCGDCERIRRGTALPRQTTTKWNHQHVPDQPTEPMSGLDWRGGIVSPGTDKEGRLECQRIISAEEGSRVVSSRNAHWSPAGERNVAPGGKSVK